MEKDDYWDYFVLLEDVYFLKEVGFIIIGFVDLEKLLKVIIEENKFLFN